MTTSLSISAWMRRCCAAITISFVVIPSLAHAHHSFAMYDHERTVTLNGTVTKFQWTNPHAYLELDVADASGEITHYSVEMTSINMMRRLGWKSSLIKPGDKVAATMSALRDGRLGGLLLEVTLPDGELWKTGVPASHTFKRTPDAIVGVH